MVAYMNWLSEHVVFDVLRDALAPLLRHGFEVGHVEGGVDVEFGQLTLLDDVAQAAHRWHRP
jgi:hypothetical protein